MLDFIPDGSAPWALAAGMIGVHSWFVTRPIHRQRKDAIALWRECEAEKKVLRDEHTEMRAELLKLSARVASIENGEDKH